MDTPYVLGTAHGRLAKIATYGDTGGAMRALVSVLLGRTSGTGPAPGRGVRSDAHRLLTGVGEPWQGHGMEPPADPASPGRRALPPAGRTLTERVAGVPDDAWSRPSPCEDWTARDLVGHLIDVHGRFHGLVGRELVDHPSVDDDPLGAWSAVRDQMQADLDDPASAAEEYDGRFGRSSFAAAVDGFVCFDLVVHGWDLARATGQDDTIDPRRGRADPAMVTAMGDDAGERCHPAARRPAARRLAQDRLLCALGRRP